MKTLAISNHKGGVGKTATAQALGAGLAGLHGLRVLMVDVDPQGSLTGACGVVDPAESLANVLGGAKPGHVAMSDIIHELQPGLYLAPADITLAPVELGLTQRLSREVVLKKVLATVANGFDVCLIDCPPSLGLLTINALFAADAVLIPTQPSPVDLRGLSLFLQTLAEVKEANPGLDVLGVLLTFYDDRLNTHRAALEAMIAAGWPVLDVKIGRTVRIMEAAAVGKTILDFEPDNPQAENYRRLTEVIYQWLNKTK